MKGLAQKFYISVNHGIKSDEPEILVQLTGIDLIWDKKAQSLFSLNGEWYDQANPANVLFDGFKECMDELMRRFFI